MSRNHMKISAGYRVFTVFNTLFMLFLLVITLYPMYYCVVASFSDPDALARAAGKVLLWPIGPYTVGAYQKVLSHSQFLSGCANTLFVLGSMAIYVKIDPSILGLEESAVNGAVAVIWGLSVNCPFECISSVIVSVAVMGALSKYQKGRRV